MPELELSKAFRSGGESLDDVFMRSEEGFYVPLYQREYTWEGDNIIQLMDDLCGGVSFLVNDENAVTFLGTIILPISDNPLVTVQPYETRALPTAVRIVIDGQQRLATIALLAIQLTSFLEQHVKHLPKSSPYNNFHDLTNTLVERLRNLYSMNLNRGDPPRKPKIIRAREDKWTENGPDDSYKSSIAHPIAVFLRNNNINEAHDAITDNRVKANVLHIRIWLQHICRAHIPDTELFGQYPVGPALSSKQMQQFLWGFAKADTEITELIDKQVADAQNPEYHASALVQLFAFTRYLLKRCGFNKLQPSNQDWGFDMFQALNATGTPLTALETFLPIVMQAEEVLGSKWETTSSCGCMERVNSLLDTTNTNEQKNALTNELLGAFALIYEGRKLGNKFSEQRKWMERTFRECSTIKAKRKFLSKLADVADFFFFAWRMSDTLEKNIVFGMENHSDRDLTSFLLTFLRAANAKLSAAMLARYYTEGLSIDNMSEFVDAVKSCAAFFTLWRSAGSVSGLDDVYRRFMRGTAAPVEVDSHNWCKHPNKLVAADLKSYFDAVLTHKSLRTKEQWEEEAKKCLKYTDAKIVCKFVLFLAADDTIADNAHLGLMKKGTAGSCPMLDVEKWHDREFKTIEHVAPQEPPVESDWDENLYVSDMTQQIGNLMILSDDLNKFAGNKGWPVKFLYYCHVGESDPDKIKALEEDAKAKGIQLSKKAITSLRSAKHQRQIEPILALGVAGNWDATFVDKRSQRIRDIVWERLNGWL